LVRPNILAVSFLFPNRVHRGYGTFVLSRLKAVQAFCNVRVIAPVQWYPFIDRLKGGRAVSGIPAHEEIEGLEVFHPRFAIIPRYLKWIDALSYWWAASGVAALLRRQQSYEYDLVDVHWTYPDIVAGYLLARRGGRKFIVTIRGNEALYDEELSVRRWLVATLLRRADFVVTLSAELRDKVIALGVAPHKTRVVLNGVDPVRFHYLERDSCRQRLGLPLSGRVLLSVGRLTQRKGHHELIRILPALIRQAPTSLYLIGGVNREEDYGAVLRRMILELGLEAHVHIVESVPQAQLALWYGAADLFCLATMSEGCPNVILESLACGTPVVATTAGAVGDIITQGEDGYLVPREELAGLGDTVRSALEREWDRRGIAARMERHGWSACAGQVVEIYRTVLQAP
jgi:glycosyltransferase involved in cell wall biosynthesis